MWVFQDGAALSRELTISVKETSCPDGLQAPSLHPRLMGGSGPMRLLALSGTRTQHILGHPAPCQELELHDICRLNRSLWQPPHPTLSPRPAPCFTVNLWENVDFLKIFSGTSPPSHLSSGFFLAPGTPRMGSGSKDLKFHVYTSLLYLRKEISSRCLPPVRTGPVAKDLQTSATSLS